MIINDFFTNPKRSAHNVAESSQRVDSLVTDALQVMQVQGPSPTVSDAVLALKRVLGDREYNGRRGFYSFYVDQILDMYGQQNLAEGADDYLDSDPATGTGNETHELDTGPLTQDPDADYDDMMQPMEEEEDGDQDVENNVSFNRLSKTPQTAMPTQSTDTAPKFPLGTKWQYVEKDADQPAAAGGNTVPVRMSMTMGNGAGDSGEITSGSKGRIDQATIDRARAWAAKMNPAAGNRTGDGVGSILNSPSQIARSQTTAPVWQDIAQANKLANPNRIYPGQQIKLPNGTFAVVDKGDTLSGIANRYRQGYYNDGTPDSQPRKTSVRETDVGNTMDDGFKWGSATMPMQDGSVHKYNPQTNSYKQATPPTRPDLNTNISTITRDRTTDKNGQANQNYSDVSIATNPATGTGDYMHRQDVNGVPTTTFQKNVPAAELAKLRSQHFNEDINRIKNLAGIRKK